MIKKRFQLSFLLLGVLSSLGADRAAVRPAVNRAEQELMIEKPTVNLNETRRPAIHYRWMEVTAYCPCQKCCGRSAQGVTASGLPVSYNQGRFVAADTDHLPFGSLVIIPGYNADSKVPVIDRGGAIKGNRIDVFYPTHQEALEWGRRWVMVGVVNNDE